ncbi:unnamed protein product [Ectocarpus sp. CCAP 1310/34]|nr:unnamed protein product [Ectocarpus sp. CCAP 1310/34]
MVLILTCLLICYNPRDSTEDILIKTGTIVRQQHKPGERGGEEPGSQAGDLEGTPGGAKNPAGASIHALRLDLVQPAGAARRAGAVGKRGAAGGSPDRSTPAMSPMAVENFLTPRRGGNRITYGPDSDGGDDGETYAYQNPRKGKSAAVGPPRAKAKTATAAAAAAAAVTTTVAPATAVAATATSPEGSRAAQEKRQHGAGAAAVAPVPTPVARLLPGAAPSRRHGEEKRSHERNHSYDSSSSADGEEEKKRDDHGCGGIMADMRPVSAGAGDENDGSDFYQKLGAQTPAAQYGGGGGGGGGIFATSRTSPTPTGAAPPLDPTRFLAGTSLVQATAASRYFPHGDGGSFQVPQSPKTPELPGGNDNGNAEKSLRLDGQTNILTSPKPADVPTSSGVEERTVVPSSSGLTSNPCLLSQQTPVASPRGGLPPTYQEHTDAVGNAARSGSPASEGHSASGDSSVGDTTGLVASLANALLARANAGDGASPTNGSENQQQEEEAGKNDPSSTPAVLLKGLMTQTPPGGVSPARPERKTLQRQPSGSAAYPRSGSDLSPVPFARGTLFQVADFPEEEEEETPSPLPVVEATAKSLPQVEMSTAVEGSRMLLGQTPITLSNADATRLYESNISTDTVPITAAEAAGAPDGGAGDEEKTSDITSGRKASTSEQQPVVEDGAPSPVVEPADQARASPPYIPLNTTLTNGVEEPAVVAGGTPSDGPNSDDATTTASATAAAPRPSTKPQSRFSRFVEKALSTDVAAPAEALPTPAAEAATAEGGSDGINGTSGDPAAAGERKTGTETGAHPRAE